MTPLELIETNCAARAVAVADHDLLVKPLTQRAGDRARDHVDAAAGGKRHDHLDRTRRPALRACE